MRGMLLFLLALCAVSSVMGHDRVLLRDVGVLTFERGLMTTGRRSAPVKQMMCTNCHSSRSIDAVTSIQCKNVGFDGVDVNWKCEAVMSKEWILGRTIVTCEGYAYPNDPYVLAGSCGVEYELNRNPGYVVLTPQRTSDSSETTFVIFIIVFIGLFTFCTMLCTLPFFSHERTVTRTTFVPETSTRTTQTTVSGSSCTSPRTVTTTHVEHHHVPPMTPQPGYVDGLATGLVMGSMSQPVRSPTVVVQQPAPTVVIQRPTPPEPLNYAPTDDTHTSTSHATTKRR